ncbi:MAG TPA: HAD family hydrolase [Pseudolysinimonas sp.]|nr:HAD family hydrolase [Pseudolysinimonas sp.]
MVRADALHGDQLNPATDGVDGILASTLFVTDLDFTLLRADATLSAFTVETINDLISHGLQFTYATARSHGSAHRATRALRLELPVITYGGTMTVDPRSGTPSAVRTVPAAVVDGILRETERAGGLAPLLHTYRDGTDRIAWRADRVTDGVRHFVEPRRGDARLTPVQRWSDDDLSGAYYVSLIGARDEVTALHARLADRIAGCAAILSEDPYAPGVHWLEIHSALGSKGVAAAALAADLGLERIVAFGDNHADIALFEAADTGYAVDNAVPELQRVATALIGHHETDAVARWLDARFPRGAFTPR